MAARLYPLRRWRGSCRALALGLIALAGAMDTGAQVDHRTYIVALPGADAADLARVEAAGGSIDHFDGVEARAYVHIRHWPAFLATGVAHRVLATQPDAQKQLTGYPSSEEIGAMLNNWAAEHSAIARTMSLGDSVQGRPLWAIHISGNPEVEEDEPEFAYISTMHGDETLGVALCLNFVELLLEGYGSNEQITGWVDGTSIWVLPLMNPDGYELGIRWNANNVDLNRAFPEYPNQFSGTILTEEPPGPAGWQPEVRRVMEWTLANQFVLVANFHGGALVANYPYDLIPGVPSGSYAMAPDDGLLRALSTAYARENPPMFASPVFSGGITNGSAWYSVNGGMQDWHYRYSGAIDITLEVSNVKSPAASTLDDFWEDNREAMLAYFAWVHRGVRGVVTDRATGAPLLAEVRVAGNAQPVFTDPDVGDYHRILTPGTYTVTVEAPGYIPFTAGVATVDAGPAARLDAALSTGDVSGDGRVDAVDVQLAINTVLGYGDRPEADVDGGGIGATDIQHLVNRALGRR